MKKSIRLALAAVATLSIAAPLSANHSWSGYHWARTGNPLKLSINTKITSQWSASVSNAFYDWDNSGVLELTAKTAPPGTDAKRCSPIAGQILVCNAAYGTRGWLGIASIWLTSGHISQATTKLNDSYFNTAAYNTPAWRALVACQEIGHDFGLGHQDEAFDNPNLGSCMDYTNDPSGSVKKQLSNEHPNGHDMDQLNTIYGSHTDSINTSSSQTASAGANQSGRNVAVAEAAAGDSPSEWGRAIHTDGLGRPDTFQRMLGPGRIRITHVYWAMGEGPR